VRVVWAKTDSGALNSVSALAIQPIEAPPAVSCRKRRLAGPRKVSVRAGDLSGARFMDVGPDSSLIVMPPEGPGLAKSRSVQVQTRLVL
jgi:hypothetical protein